jgi:hypothetical protein
VPEDFGLPEDLARLNVPEDPGLSEERHAPRPVSRLAPLADGLTFGP